MPCASWEGVDAAELAARCGVPAAHLHARVDSTNDVARSLADEGAPHGTLVLSEAQAAGRGRAGRAWASPPGLGLWLSLVLRPAPGAGAPELLPLRVGLGAALGIETAAGEGAARLKWPNDVLLGERKVAGVLCEATWSVGRAPSFVAGIGVNVLHRPADFPPELRDTATSIAAATGRAPDRVALLSAIVAHVLRLVDAPAGPLGPEVLAGIARRDALRGRAVLVSDPATGRATLHGTALGIAADGALLLRTEAGVLRRVLSGSVRPTGADVGAAVAPDHILPANP